MSLSFFKNNKIVIALIPTGNALVFVRTTAFI